MHILVFGNIGSGKSWFCNVLRQDPRIRSRFSYLAIDHFRRTLGDNTNAGELRAREAFFAALDPGRNEYLIEATGFGHVGKGLVKIFEPFLAAVSTLQLLQPPEVCAAHLAGRRWDVPYPHNYPDGEPSPEMLDRLTRIHQEIASGLLAAAWKNARRNLFLHPRNDSWQFGARLALDILLESGSEN
jgi:hypothetical protein